MCVSSTTTKHRSGTLLYRRLWSSAAWAHRSCASRPTFMTENPIALSTRKREDSRHVREIPWPSGQWRAGRRIDTGHAGRIHGREHARGHVQPCCRGWAGVGQGKGCRCRRRSGGGPPSWCNAYGRGRYPAVQRTCARPTRRTGGGMGSITARPGASNCTGRWRQ